MGVNWIEVVQELDFLQGASPDGIRIATTSAEGTMGTFVQSIEELVALACLLFLQESGTILRHVQAQGWPAQLAETEPQPGHNETDHQEAETS